MGRTGGEECLGLPRAGAWDGTKRKQGGTKLCGLVRTARHMRTGQHHDAHTQTHTHTAKGAVGGDGSTQLDFRGLVRVGRREPKVAGKEAPRVRGVLCGVVGVGRAYGGRWQVRVT